MTVIEYAFPGTKTTELSLNEQDLMEIMVALIEIQKSPICAQDRKRRIEKLLKEKIDPAIRELRIG